MPTIISQLAPHFRQAISAALGLEADPLLSISQNERFGDYQSNAAMSLAKTLSDKTGQKTNPRALAEQIKSKLNLTGIAQEITIAGPGFINVRLSPAYLAEQLQVMRADPRLGIEKIANPQAVVVDYSGPNIAKEMHVGHLRSTIIGDAISRILEFQGHQVIRQNHIGDWGTQFGMLIAYLGDGQNSSGIKDLEGFYRQAKKRFDDDENFANKARARVVKLQRKEPAELALWEQIVQETRRHYQPLYEQMGVNLCPSDERGESFYNSMLPTVVSDLKSLGIAVQSEGATVAFVEGFESPLIIEKTGGGYLYAATDLAAIRYRMDSLHANRIIYVTDSRQSQHFQQVFSVAGRAGWVKGDVLEHSAFGTMLGEDGKPFKTRSGDLVKLKDLLDEAEERAERIIEEKNPELPAEQKRKIAHAVGIGAIKYADLSKDRARDYVFSWEQMLAMDGNTAPYLQYAHARVQAIFRKAATDGGSCEAASGNTGIILAAAAELALAKHIVRLGEIIELVGRELKPHHLCTYLYELATKFSGFYENCPVLQSEPATRQSRLALCDLTAKVMRLGLDLLGIGHPDQM